MINTPSRDLLTRSVDATAFGRDAITEMGALFRATSKAADRSSETESLANIGSYLSDNWAGLLDCENEELKRVHGGLNHE